MIKVREVESIVAQMGEPRALPMGRAEFDHWSDRIISGALIPGPEGKTYELEDLQMADPNSDVGVFYLSLKNALCGLLLHIGPTESHKPDAYFIHALRVSAVKQVGVMISEELRAKAKERHARKLEAVSDAELS